MNPTANQNAIALCHTALTDIAHDVLGGFFDSLTSEPAIYADALYGNATGYIGSPYITASVPCLLTSDPSGHWSHEMTEYAHEYEDSITVDEYESGSYDPLYYTLSATITLWDSSNTATLAVQVICENTTLNRLLHEEDFTLAELADITRNGTLCSDLIACLKLYRNNAGFSNPTWLFK